MPPFTINQRAPVMLAALLSAAGAASVAPAQPAAEWQPQLVALDESGNLNQPNYRFDAHHTAGGYWQITDTNWRQFAPMAGIDLTRCPNALSCSFDEQGRVAGWMWARLGFLPWVPYNSRLRRDLFSARVLTAATDPHSLRTQHPADPRGGDDSLTGSGAKPFNPHEWHDLDQQDEKNEDGD